MARTEWHPLSHDQYSDHWPGNSGKKVSNCFFLFNLKVMNINLMWLFGLLWKLTLDPNKYLVNWVDSFNINLIVSISTVKLGQKIVSVRSDLSTGAVGSVRSFESIGFGSWRWPSGGNWGWNFPQNSIFICSSIFHFCWYTYCTSRKIFLF